MVSLGYVQSKIDEVRIGDPVFNEKILADYHDVPPKDPKDTDPPPEDTKASTSQEPPAKRTKRQQAMDKKKKEEEEESQTKPKTRAEIEANLKKSQSRIGKIPPYPKNQDFRPLDLPFGFQSLAQYNRLQSYLAMNGPYLIKTTPADGACLFHSLVDMMAVEQEFTQVHARRQIILYCAEHPEFFYGIVKKCIEAEYGHKRLSPEEVQDLKESGLYEGDIKKNQELPGPFTYVEWMSYMLQGDSWGDSAILHVLPYAFQSPVISIDADTLTSDRYRNKLPLPKQDFVFCYVNGNHYMGASKFLFHLRLYMCGQGFVCAARGLYHAARV